MGRSVNAPMRVSVKMNDSVSIILSARYRAYATTIKFSYGDTNLRISLSPNAETFKEFADALGRFMARPTTVEELTLKGAHLRIEATGLSKRAKVTVRYGNVSPFIIFATREAFTELRAQLCAVAQFAATRPLGCVAQD